VRTFEGTYATNIKAAVNNISTNVKLKSQAALADLALYTLCKILEMLLIENQLDYFFR
jgi:hypothetical protein